MRLQKSIPSAAKDTLSKKGTYFAKNISPVYVHFKIIEEKTRQIYHSSYHKVSGEELHKSWLKPLTKKRIHAMREVLKYILDLPPYPAHFVIRIIFTQRTKSWCVSIFSFALHMSSPISLDLKANCNSIELQDFPLKIHNSVCCSNIRNTYIIWLMLRVAECHKQCHINPIDSKEKISSTVE